jgi:hypothetical protein
MLFESNSLHQFDCGPRFEEREGLLQEVLLDFRGAFPEIEFEIHSESPTINAQAIIHGETRIVRLYGGLAFHPLAESDLLVFALLHEVGHHLSSGGRLAFCESLGCECAADRWAVRRGVSSLRQRSGRTLDVGHAVDRLDALAATVAFRRPVASDSEARPSGCWAMDWPTRKLHLTGHIPMPITRRCRLSEFYVLRFSSRMEKERWVH